MNLSVPVWSMPSLSLAESAGVARALGFDGLDIGGPFDRDRKKVLDDPEAAAATVCAHGLPVANYFHIFGGGDVERRTLADPGARAENIRELEAAARFCAAASIPTLMVGPGVLNPGQGLEQAREESASALREAHELASPVGVQIVVEPHVKSILESPRATLAFLEAVPGVKIALDPSHFVCLGIDPEEADVLIPHAGHIHLREARPGRLQAPVGEGTINLNVFLSKVAASGYEGWIAAEPLHTDFLDSLDLDVLSELVELRDLVRGWFGPGGAG